MFSKILVALNDLPESQHALRRAIDLARLCNADLATVSILGDAILHFLKEQKADLLVVGLHQHDFYLSRLWSSVYDLAQDSTCSVLGVH
jgi:nucleotide-binding universal stress UspA family protein